MAIVIPSKKIYKTTHKLPKNHIDKVEYKRVNLNYSVEYLTLAETKSYDLEADTRWQNNPINQHDDNSAGDTRWNGSTYIYHEAVAHIETYYVKLTITIDKYQSDGLKEILKLYSGWKSEEQLIPNISCTVTYAKGEGDFLFKGEDDFNFDYAFTTTSTQVEQIENNYTYEYEISPTIVTKPSAGVTVENKGNIVDASFEPDENGNYKIELIIKVGNKYWGYGQDKELTVNGTVLSRTAVHSVYKKPLFLEISFYGDIGQYEKVEIPLTQGTGKNVFAMETNELIQGGGSRGVVLDNSVVTITYEDQSPNGGRYIRVEKPPNFEDRIFVAFSYTDTDGHSTYIIRPMDQGLSSFRVEVGSPNDFKLHSVRQESSTGTDTAVNIINAYKNGKETAELLCSIGEYKDTNGELAISTKDYDLPMTFNNGDIVVPYKYTARGDAPLSTKKDGKTPKGFLVTGVEFIFDGAVWQKITLQEN